ncbi:LysR family transcriptional regulator [Psychromonas sp. psych-6C06]|uniref:LysR family transcriptional regulator n=1 Tax=Psychromonas sp. psych-6C06 TaxID=2058089 RepID=UPI000C332D2F|nr:LysR family transcriptional regulator [Psychromonas sp. psych-6C06]PKF60787.1 LysR family transcriptional regulator [Psychromonas sp. psych-6C06]
MDTLDGFKTVIAVVETGSFTAAAIRLDMSKALVSKYVGEVEKQLGIRLFNRSTRKLSLTEAGQSYYQGALSLTSKYEQLVDTVTGEQTNPRGLLRISTSVTFGDTLLSPKLPLFLKQYPDLKAEVLLTDRKIDMLEEGVDVLIRIGGVDDSTLIARQINHFPLLLCASPEFIKTHGKPQRVADLLTLNCIVDSNFAIAKQWPFTDKNGHTETITINSNVSVNSPRSVRALAIAGAGVALVPQFIVQQSLNNGELVQVLPEYKTLSFGMFAIYPHRRYLPKKVSCFVEFLFEQFSADMTTLFTNSNKT